VLAQLSSNEVDVSSGWVPGDVGLWFAAVVAMTAVWTSVSADVLAQLSSNEVEGWVPDDVGLWFAAVVAMTVV